MQHCRRHQTICLEWAENHRHEPPLLGAGSTERRDYGREYMAGHWHPWQLARGYSFIAMPQKRQGLQEPLPEVIAFRQGWINAEQLAVLADTLKKNGYGHDLLSLLKWSEPGVEESERCLSLPFDNMSRSIARVFFTKRGQNCGRGMFWGYPQPVGWWGLAQKQIRPREKRGLLNPVQRICR